MTLPGIKTCHLGEWGGRRQGPGHPPPKRHCLYTAKKYILKKKKSIAVFMFKIRQIETHFKKGKYILGQIICWNEQSAILMEATLI